MLNNQKITIVADTVIDDVKIASYGAIIDIANGHLNMSNRNIDEVACKTFKDIVRKDRNDFEDFAYTLQDTVTKMCDTNGEA